ncbi:MAG: hypothetical protein WA666_10920 [Nitrospirota bacterium]
MKKIILSLSFIIVMFSGTLPAFADTSNTFWDYSGVPNVKGSVMKATVVMNYFTPGTGVQKPVKYTVNHLTFHLTRDSSGVADTDISISGVNTSTQGTLSLFAGMQGGALTVGKTIDVSACYNAAMELVTPFNFSDDASFLMTANEVMATTANGILIETFQRGTDLNKANVQMTFKMVGPLEANGNPARIVVNILGTANAQ